MAVVAVAVAVRWVADSPGGPPVGVADAEVAHHVDRDFLRDVAVGPRGEQGAVLLDPDEG